MIKLAVFVSGRGSNLKAVIEKIDNGSLDAEVCAVVSDKSACPALEFASGRGIKTFPVSFMEKEGFFTYGELESSFDELGIQLVVLAGFLKLIPETFVDKYENRLINIHPALLPSFGGKGMYGMNVHKAVYNSSAKISGATVHFVNKIYDEGKIIDQKCVDISDVKSPEEISERVLEVEHVLLPRVIKKFSENKIKIFDNRVVFS